MTQARGRSEKPLSQPITLGQPLLYISFNGGNGRRPLWVILNLNFNVGDDRVIGGADIDHGILLLIFSAFSA